MSDLSLFHFLRPAWLLLLPLAILIPWLWQRARRPSGDWARVCDPHLLKWLSVGSATGRNRGAGACLLYTSPSPRDLSTSRMPSSA